VTFGDPLGKSRQFRKVLHRRNAAQLETGLAGGRFDYVGEVAAVHRPIIAYRRAKSRATSQLLLSFSDITTPVDV